MFEALCSQQFMAAKAESTSAEQNPPDTHKMTEVKMGR